MAIPHHSLIITHDPGREGGWAVCSGNQVTLLPAEWLERESDWVVLDVSRILNHITPHHKIIVWAIERPFVRSFEQHLGYVQHWQAIGQINAAIAAHCRDRSTVKFVSPSIWPKCLHTCPFKGLEQKKNRAKVLRTLFQLPSSALTVERGHLHTGLVDALGILYYVFKSHFITEIFKQKEQLLVLQNNCTIIKKKKGGKI